VADTPTAGMIWAHATRQSRPARSSLDRDTVVRAAIGMLDTDGVDGLSMRKLGTALGATAPTLYWHVSSKDELLDLAFDEVMHDLPDMRAVRGDDWPADVRSALDALRAMMLRHRWYPGLYATRPSIGPNALRYWGGLLDVLARAGFTDADLDNAFCMLSDHVVGSAAIQLSYDAWLASPPADIEAAHSYVRDAVRPNAAYARYIDGYIAVTPAAERRERRYQYALDCMLDALQRRLTEIRFTPSDSEDVGRVTRRV
jgi:AcrR family transcriptional regulator